MHRLHCVRVHPDSASAVVLGGIRRYNLPTNSEIRREATSGAIYATHTALIAQKPAFTFETLHVAQAMALCSFTGLIITATTNPGLTAFAAKQNGSTLLSGSVHRSYQMKYGLLIPDTLSCDHQGDASITYQMLIAHDGSVNDPILMADNVALPTQTTTEERYGLGPTTIGSALFTGVKSFSLSFGVSAETVGSDGDVWDTKVRIIDVMPKITYSGIDIEWVKAANIPLTSACATHATCSQVLRKRKECGGTWELPASTVHTKITFNGIIYAEELFDGQGNALGKCNVCIEGKYDGTNPPLVITTGVAYGS